ncbi:hypothetical protein ACFY9R_29100 [Streptomyces albidoflavus]|uniref:hypothetical protein n=1 Tax=Streptomyces albidoflavus TaxID=1886 RepID=UPI0033FE9879
MPITAEPGRRVIFIGYGSDPTPRPGIITALDTDGIPLIRLDGHRCNLRINPNRLPPNKHLHLLNHTGPVPALPMGRFQPTAHNLKADEYDGIPVIELDGDQVIAITDDINQALHAITHYGNDHDWAHINITADRLRSEWVAFEWQPEDAEYEWLTIDASPGDDKAVHTYRLPY